MIFILSLCTIKFVCFVLHSVCGAKNCLSFGEYIRLPLVCCLPYFWLIPSLALPLVIIHITGVAFLLLGAGQFSALFPGGSPSRLGRRFSCRRARICRTARPSSARGPWRSTDVVHVVVRRTSGRVVAVAVAASGGRSCAVGVTTGRRRLLDRCCRSGVWFGTGAAAALWR